MRRIVSSKWLLLGVAAAIIAIAYLRHAETPRAPTADGSIISGRAVAVDGDSLLVGTTRVRLWGIDAPEAKQDCNDTAGRWYACGREAQHALSDAIGRDTVSCTVVEMPSYDRQVARCTAGGRDLGEAMVRSGHAIELPSHSRGRYAVAEREARAARRGLWTGSFERPAQWRAEHAR